ncbi:uncharacterized protein MYCFIDRAFT_35624 [Pseudocercospora fijiensis CIRAD86]|uniref:MPR-like GPCR protein n=1 Tax=Pseudocercospora fijiensis (strain CIRAD86) TaxID=383855 RepID=N1QC09_PSEFD|nr:uncharacterized protein MYCFIDRAFT_35624 [Pseudocercospora fijiensis CIRAD86]EME88842.1 hypothetical protein MYCFIDRAFT_35624 [Pseudocercospora fijiensis CIRAD86]
MAGFESEKTSASSSNALQTGETRAEKALTILWSQLPEWMQDNQFIHSGYRPPSNSYARSAASIGSWHNETINIWSHLIGALLAGSAGTKLYFSIRPRFEMATTEDVMVFSCFFLGAVACLGMSATYHTISNHSHAVAKLGNRLDYIGIVFLIWGSFIPSIFYGFSAEPHLINLYWSMITTIGAGTVLVVLHPKFRSPSWRPFRAFMFVMMGLSAVFPVLHGLSIHGWAEVEQRIALSWLITQGLLYIIGAMIYAARVPERWKPGAFDILGSSHQIFHVLVVAAAAVHLKGLLKAFDHEYGVRTESSYPGVGR